MPPPDASLDWGQATVGITDRAATARAARWLYWGWLLGAGVLLFAAWWLQRHGLWLALVRGDPSGISVGIVVITLLTSIWCGRRAGMLARQAGAASHWRLSYRAERRALPEQAPQMLAERSHGPHETAWWFAGSAIKLGLLGTVVGFMVMSLQLSKTAGLQFEDVPALLGQMTQGMAIALYTTLVGLVANLLLGAQLLLLDRMADRVVADIVGGEPITVPAS